MKLIRAVACCWLAVVLLCGFARSQDRYRAERFLGIPAKERPLAPLARPEGFAEHIVGGKLVLSLDDSIRLAMTNNTDIRVDEVAVDVAENNIHRQHQLFDPIVTGGFNDQRVKSQTSSQLQGAQILNTLSQTTQFGYGQTFATGTNLQTTFQANKFSTNSGFQTLNPSYATSWQFVVTQPLLKNFGTFANKAPLYVAQRNYKQNEATFKAEVSNVLLQVITQYWSVVLSHQAYEVQKKSYDEAQTSYERDKKALSLGALPPLDIYRSESEVAARRVGLIQAEYAVKQAEDQFRQVIGADRDTTINALDIQLTEKLEPGEQLRRIDIGTAMTIAMANRPELEAADQQLASDAISLRLAHNNLRPDLELSGIYAPSGVAGNMYSATVPPVLVSTGGIGDSLSQMLGLKYPTYGGALTLRLPIKNHAAEADLADAKVTQRGDQYRQARTLQQINLEVTNAVHQLEQATLSLEAAKISEDLAQKNLRAEERKYQLGNSTVFFVLDAQTQLAQAEFSVAQAQTQYQTAMAAVDHATGKLLETHYVKLAPRARTK
ncbi:MAG TPA: TolC family protein [Candidatus Limnocylindrales bacterium]|nr:TolC family protein [Candidatus Limnocylindrales bacterium]